MPNSTASSRHADGSLHHPRFSRWYGHAEPIIERWVGTARRAQNAQAIGRTLILGAGTGLDIPALGPQVTDVVLLEPDPTMGRVLARRYPDYALVASPAEAMPFPAEAFETVISSLVLCSVADPDRVLAEIARILTADGQYLMLEHVASSHRGIRWIQHGVDPVWRRVGGGCRLTRDVYTAVALSPLSWASYEPVRDGGLLPVIRGRALKVPDAQPVS